MKMLFRLLLAAVLSSPVLAWAGKRPNIVFCLADDWGWPHAGVYGDKAVKTPSFDRLAKEGMLFHHAYVSSPSCTPCRNAFITGKYHWQLGSGANLWSRLPVEHESFIHLLKDSGYVIGRSRAKTYGPGPIKDWEAKHGGHPSGPSYMSLGHFLSKAKPGDKPFFFWLGTSDPHRGYRKGSGAKSGIDLDTVHLFPHYPDAKEVRSDVADYYYEVQRWDRLVGRTLAVLEQQGLLKNTIVIMSGDHGMPFPRCKGNLYDSGVRVPFAVRWGTSVPAGRECNRFVSFVDIAPTLLELAGVKKPDTMTGTSFAKALLSTDPDSVAGPKDIVFGRERHTPAQEKPDTGGYPSRGLRNHEFLYIRNYSPERWPAGTPYPGRSNRGNQWYADCDGSPTKNYIVLNQDKDEAHRRSFDLCFAKRPSEELYDLKKDPGQINNVAGNAEYAKTVESMRARMTDRLKELKDPRATRPGDNDHFDRYPYFGGGGGKMPKEVRDALKNKGR
jgi:arylsulfatase A-like enzyme